MKKWTIVAAITVILFLNSGTGFSPSFKPGQADRFQPAQGHLRILVWYDEILLPVTPFLKSSCLWGE